MDPPEIFVQFLVRLPRCLTGTSSPKQKSTCLSDSDWPSTLSSSGPCSKAQRWPVWDWYICLIKKGRTKGVNRSIYLDLRSTPGPSEYKYPGIDAMRSGNSALSAKVRTTRVERVACTQDLVVANSQWCVKPKPKHDLSGTGIGPPRNGQGWWWCQGGLSGAAVRPGSPMECLGKRMQCHCWIIPSLTPKISTHRITV